MNFISGIAIFAGAGLGALLRWTLGHFLNPAFPSLPPGTLAANLLGALAMGILMGAFLQYENMSPVMRLALTTGFLGGLTTFSTFSAEAVTLLLRGEYRWALIHVLAHVVGSLLATLLGIASIRWLFTTLGATP